MKDFDLRLALDGHPVCLAGGCRVTQLVLFESCADQHKLFGVTDYGKVLSWRLCGSFGYPNKEIPTMDLKLFEPGDELWS